MPESLKWGVSADSSGLLTGMPEMWRKLWGPAIASHPEGFVGFEMFPWGWLKGTEAILKQALELKTPIAAIHGRTGGIHDAYSWADRVIMMGLNGIMPDSVDLIQNFGTRVPRIILHAPEYRSKKLREFLLGNVHSVRELAVENHVHIGSGGTAVEVALMLKDELEIKNVAIVFDIFHCADAEDHHGNDWIKRWEGVRRQAGWILDNAARYGFKVHLHVPVGPGRDGLPTEFITGDLKKLWKVLADDLEGAWRTGLLGDRIIENQQVFLNAVGVYGQAITGQIEWNKKVVKVLAGEGII